MFQKQFMLEIKLIAGRNVEEEEITLQKQVAFQKQFVLKVQHICNKYYRKNDIVEKGNGLKIVDVEEIAVTSGTYTWQ